MADGNEQPLCGDQETQGLWEDYLRDRIYQANAEIRD